MSNQITIIHTLHVYNMHMYMYVCTASKWSLCNGINKTKVPFMIECSLRMAMIVTIRSITTDKILKGSPPLYIKSGHVELAEISFQISLSSLHVSWYNCTAYRCWQFCFTKASKSVGARNFCLVYEELCNKFKIRFWSTYTMRSHLSTSYFTLSRQAAPVHPYCTVCSGGTRKSSFTMHT